MVLACELFTLTVAMNCFRGLMTSLICMKYLSVAKV
jgi:hypothetical protein